MAWFKSARYPQKLRNLARENPAAVFIVGFQVLLLVSAGFSIGGNSMLADGIAVYSYLSLVIGIALQFAYFIRDEKGAEEKT